MVFCCECDIFLAWSVVTREHATSWAYLVISYVFPQFFKPSYVLRLVYFRNIENAIHKDHSHYKTT